MLKKGGEEGGRNGWKKELQEEQNRMKDRDGNFWEGVGKWQEMGNGENAGEGKERDEWKEWE